MRRSRFCAVVLLVVHSVAGAPGRPIPAQKYAPLVGQWSISVTVDGVPHTLTFATDGQGQGGFGTGTLRIATDGDRHSRFPASWNNRTPDVVRISSEVELGQGAGAVRGTLILKAQLAAGAPIRGRAVLLDGDWQRHEGEFEMTRTKGPTEIVGEGSGESLRR